MQKGGGSCRSLEAEAEPVKPFRQRQRLVLIFVCQRDNDDAMILQFHAGSLNGLAQRPVEPPVVADGLAGRLHLG